MKSIKRITSVCLVLLMLLQPCIAFAQSNAAVTAESVTAAPGETVSIVLKLENNPGINALKLSIGYDSSVLTLLSATDQNLFGSVPTKSRYITDNPYNVIWATAGNITENGQLLELVFRISETAPIGIQTIAITSSSAFNEAEKAVAITAQNAEIAIQKLPVKILAMTMEHERVAATVQVNDGISAKALCGIYEPDGKMISAQFAALQAGENALHFTGCKAGCTAKLFVLESTTAKPLCSALEVQ